MHNVPESTVDDGPARKDDDNKFISTTFQQYLGVSTKIDKAERLGKSNDEDSEKSRLLKISVSSEVDKALLLQSCLNYVCNKNNPEDIKSCLLCLT